MPDTVKNTNSLEKESHTSKDTSSDNGVAGTTGLLLVSRHRLGDTPDNTRRMPEKREDIIFGAAGRGEGSLPDWLRRRFQIEDGSLDLSHPAYQSTLEKIYEKKAWIGCMCRKGTPFKDGPVPLMTVQERDRYCILRMPKRPGHAEGCPLRGEGGRSDPNRKVGGRVDRVCFHRKSPERTAVETEGDQNSERTYLPSRRSGMERCLYTLIEDAGLNRTDGSKVGQFEAFKSVAEAAGEIDLREFILKDYLWTKPWAIPEAANQIRNDWEKWPKNSDGFPHGVFVFRANATDGQRIVYGDDEEYHDVAQKIEVRAKEAGGPLLFLMTVAGSKERPKWIEPRKAFGIPIIGNGLYVPIESGWERAMGTYLVEEIRRINSNQENPVTLQKRLFVETTQLGDCRPDFSLHWRGEEIPIRLTDSLETYRGAEEEKTDTTDYARLEEMGLPIVFETGSGRGDDHMQRINEPINERLEEIRKKTGGKNQPRMD